MATGISQQIVRSICAKVIHVALSTDCAGKKFLSTFEQLESVNSETAQAIFCHGLIGGDIKTTVKIRNILFATFTHTYQLLLYIVDAPT